MVTYGDMMGLLLCFFVTLVSMSEIKKDQRFQEALESIRTAFGYEGTIGALPVATSSKNSLVEQLNKVIVPDRTKQEGDSDDAAMDGRVFRVTSVREGVHVEIGGAVSFDRFQATLKPEGTELLRRLAEKTVGHNTVINVRGHATPEPLPPDSPYRDPMDLSTARARNVADVFTQFGIRPERLRIVGAGSYEPLLAQAYTEERQAANRRVEVIVTEAIVDDFAGQPLP